MLHQEAKVINIEYEGANVVIEAAVSPVLAGILKDYHDTAAPAVKPDPWA